MLRPLRTDTGALDFDLQKSIFTRTYSTLENATKYLSDLLFKTKSLVKINHISHFIQITNINVLFQRQKNNKMNHYKTYIKLAFLKKIWLK